MRNGDPRTEINKLTYPFIWELEHPFLPWGHSEATFYHGMWRATFTPLSRTFDSRTFKFVLRLVPPFYDGYPGTMASSLIASMKLNGNPIFHRTASGYFFRASNHFQWELRGRCRIEDPEQTPRLVIEVSIELQSPPPEDEFGNDEADEYQLKLLSNDMKRLFIKAPHSDLILVSAPNYPEAFAAHSYILRVRWNGFFDEHGSQQAGAHVELHMSATVLQDVLLYMYCGKFDVPMSDRDEAYITELLQVVDYYSLCHLRKSFLERDLVEVRIDDKLSYNYSESFPLHAVDDLMTIDDISYTKEVQLDSEILFLGFQVSKDKGAGPWLTYSIRSNAERTFHVRLVLLFEQWQRRKSRDPRMAVRRVVHHGDHCIFPRATFGSGPILHLGCREMFPELNPETLPSHGAVEHSIRAIWHITDGIKLARIEHKDGIPELDRDSLLTLSNNMDQLYRDTNQNHQGDLILVSGYNDETLCHRLHKGICATRVPEWQQVFEGCEDMTALPDQVRCHISCQAMQHILDYMYTAKSTHIPDYVEDEIEDFAIRGGGCKFLLNLIHPETDDSDSIIYGFI